MEAAGYWNSPWKLALQTAVTSNDIEDTASGTTYDQNGTRREALNTEHKVHKFTEKNTEKRRNAKYCSQVNI